MSHWHRNKAWIVALFSFLMLLLGNTAFPQLGSHPAEEWIKRLEDPKRLTNKKINEVISRLNLKPGDAVADIGAGSGVFSRPLAKAVAPTGKILAEDIEKGLLDYIEKRAAQEKINNIQTILGKPDDPKLPLKVDLIFIYDVLHHIEHRQTYLKKLPSYLKPGGRVVIVDFFKDWPPRHEQMRFSQEDFMQWMESAGFHKVREFDLFEDKFFMVFETK